MGNRILSSTVFVSGAQFRGEKKLDLLTTIFWGEIKRVVPPLQKVEGKIKQVFLTQGSE